MNSPQLNDLADIRAYLSYRCTLTKTKGFSSLIKQVLKQDLHQKEKEEYHRVLFDCFFKFGTVPLGFLIESLPALVREKVINKKSLWQEFFVRLPNINIFQFSLFDVIEVCQPSFAYFLSLISSLGTSQVTHVCSNYETRFKYRDYFKVLLFSGLLTDEQKRIVGNDLFVQEQFLKYYPKLYPFGCEKVHDSEKFLRECPVSQIAAYEHVRLDIFQCYQLIRDRPEILDNKSLKSHCIFLPFVIMSNHYRQLVVNILEPAEPALHKNDLAVRYDTCSKNSVFLTADFPEHKLNVESYIGYIIQEEKIASFISFLENYKDCPELQNNPHIFPSLGGFFYYTTDFPMQKRICDLLIYFVEQRPEFADEYVLYFLSMYAKRFVQVDRKLIVDVIVRLAVNQYAISTICMSLSLMIKKGDHRSEALEGLSRVVAKYPAAAKAVVNTVDLFSSVDSDDVFYGMLKLATECCKAIEDNDELITDIDRAMRTSEGIRLAACVAAIADLVKFGVFELGDVRKSLAKRVQNNENDDAITAYCRFLSMGSSLDKEDETEQVVRLECIRELYEFTKSNSSLVVSEAWKCLGAYEVEVMTESAKLTLSFVSDFAKLNNIQLDGFIDFMSRCMNNEIESYQRPWYNTDRNVDVFPILSKVDIYKEQLIHKNGKEPWFWAATLPLSASIIQLMPSSNRAASAMKLLLECLENVSPSTSHEEMLRRMAGWRSCVKEVLNVLIEYKDNDIIWARDQIVNTGRMSLTNKCESVDNIMMMLTCLADAISESLKVNDNQKLVVEVSKLQQPWLLSVYEFVATRLPKKVKQKREKKHDPIYQLITNSNKSSVLTAIFCIRLLYIHPHIAKFYSNEDLGLEEDPILICLLHDSSKELNKEEIPAENMLWITPKAYGCDDLSAKQFEASCQPIVNAIAEKQEALKLDYDDDNAQMFATILQQVNSKEISQKHRKTVEKMWNNGDEMTKKAIYELLAEMAMTHPTGPIKKPVSVDKLPASSILREIIHLFDEKNNIDVEKLRNIFRALVNHRRKDGRFLPPVDWLTYLERAEWKKSESASRLAIITLACEQGISEILYYYATDLTTEELLVIAQHLDQVIKLLPRRELMNVLQKMADESRKGNNDMKISEKFAAAIAKNESNPVVHTFLLKNLPNLTKTLGITDPILKALKEPNAFEGLISECFDAWLEARHGEKMNIKRICDLFDLQVSTLGKTSICALVSHESRTLTVEKRFDKLLDVITASRIARCESRNMESFGAIFFSLIVSLNKKVDLPLCWFECEKELPMIIRSAIEPFFMRLVESYHMRTNVKHISSFLRQYVDGEESELEDIVWQRECAFELLLILIANFYEEAIPNLLVENDSFWKEILSIKDRPAPKPK